MENVVTSVHGASTLTLTVCPVSVRSQAARATRAKTGVVSAHASLTMLGKTVTDVHQGIIGTLIVSVSCFY